ncbi:MAG: hypothetical protein LW627_06725 [Ilumatobacteraceae bacterium]|nr:hypothetical protein [Ilumatobacteraceae bacterium]
MDNHVPDVLRSDDGRLLATIDPDHGGRLTQLVFDGTPLLIGADHPLAHHPLGWGCYPMVPYCGRVRDARLSFAGRSHRLSVSAAPHSIHGTTFDRRWDIVEVDDSSVELCTDLGPQWPFLGRAVHHVSVGRGSLTMRLTVEADEDMPVMVGWHPWFVKPESSPTELRTMLRRDDSGIATDECVHRPAGPIDDCFVGCFDGRTNDVDELLTFRVANVDLDLSSDCTHWVLYDEPSHATCVEPQSGPPNQVNDAPVVLAAGQSMTRWFRIRMSTS